MKNCFKFFWIALLPCTTMVMAQNKATTYQIGPFSSKYNATLTTNNNNGDVFMPGVIRVYSNTGKKLIEVESNELILDLQQGKVKANVHQLPYGEQSVLMYEDFDFDNVKDFAIMDGQNSCYHGPSFQIYLVKSGNPVFSSAFTQLAQNYCGMFDVNRKNKTLSTMTKSGCCWHQFNTYGVRHNKPYLLHSTEETFPAFSMGFLEITESARVGSNLKTTVRYQWLNPDESGKNKNMIFSFVLLNQPNKKAIVFDNQGTLDYILVRLPDNQVEFGAQLAALGYLPKSKRQEDVRFFGNANRTELAFQNLDALYRIVDSPMRLGVEVQQGDKKIFLPGNNKQRLGGLQQLLKKQFINVCFSCPLPK